MLRNTFCGLSSMMWMGMSIQLLQRYQDGTVLAQLAVEQQDAAPMWRLYYGILAMYITGITSVQSYPHPPPPNVMDAAYQYLQ